MTSILIKLFLVRKISVLVAIRIVVFSKFKGFPKGTRLAGSDN